MDDGSLRIVDRKKDIIITAGGKNIAPQELEARLKANSLVGEAIVIGDQRPYLVSLISLDADEAKAFLHHHGIESATDAEIYNHPSVLEVVEGAVADVNATFSRAEGIRRWSIVEGGFPAEAMTPTLKLKRRVINEVFEAEVEALYS
jgi:long-chain acyl-CoA synthetase